MESATFETTRPADLAVLILFDVIKSTKRDFSTTMLVLPPIKQKIKNTNFVNTCKGGDALQRGPRFGWG